MTTEIKGQIKVKLAWLEPGHEVVAVLDGFAWSMSTGEARRLAIDLWRAAGAVETTRLQGKPECPSCGGTDTHTSGCAL